MKRFFLSGYSVVYVSMKGSQLTSLDNFKLYGEDFSQLFQNVKFFHAKISDKDGSEKFNQVIQEFKPDIVFSNLDPWDLDIIALSVYRNSYYWIHYSTIETPFYSPNVMYPTPIVPYSRKSIQDILSRVDLLIPVTNMGKKAFEFLKLNSTENIYNGIDIEKVCTDSYVTRQNIFGEVITNNDFLFMTMGINNERKKLDVLLEAFAKFLKKMDNNKQKYKLYMHCSTEDILGGTDIVTQIQVLGLRNNVFAPKVLQQKKLMTREEIFKRYYLSDCYIALPAGEGFGLGFPEAMLHKKPVIYIDYGGHAEYCKDIGLPVKVKETFAARNIYMKWALADTDDAVKQMCRIVSDKKLREKLGQKGYEFVINNFGWDTIFEKLENLVMTNYKKYYKSGIFKFRLKKVI